MLQLKQRYLVGQPQPIADPQFEDPAYVLFQRIRDFRVNQF